MRLSKILQGRRLSNRILEMLLKLLQKQSPGTQTSMKMPRRKMIQAVSRNRLALLERTTKSPLFKKINLARSVQRRVHRFVLPQMALESRVVPSSLLLRELRK